VGVAAHVAPAVVLVLAVTAVGRHCGGATTQVPRQRVDQARTLTAVRLGLLETVDHVSQVDRAILLTLLARPAQQTGPIDVALLEGTQERVYL